MVALLVAMNVMAVLLAVALPVWNQMVRREKEAELVFRGEQYVRALELYQRRQGPGTVPPSIDVLVQERYLRKAFKDPITGQDFLVLSRSQLTGQAQPGRGAAPGGGRGGQADQPPAAGARGGASAGFNGNATLGVVGVASRSTDESIRLYNGRNHYDEWEFIYLAQAQTPGGVPGAGAGGPAGRGGPDAGPGGGRGARGGRGAGRDGRGGGDGGGRGGGRQGGPDGGGRQGGRGFPGGGRGPG
jgi:type II secretory pathway pseudopilin PulG